MKRLLSCLIIFALLFTLVACGNTPSNGDATPTPSEDPTETPAMIDLTEGGKYMNYEGAAGNPAHKLQALSGFTSNTITVISNNNHNIESTDFHAFRDVYGLDSQTDLTNDIITKFISQFMANSSPDIVAFTGINPSLINKGYLADWEQYIDFSLGLWEDLRESIEGVRFGGKIYTVSESAARQGLVWFNYALFEEQGVKNPMDHYLEGTWDWNTFRDLAKAMTIDADSDGIPEVWGCGISEPMMFVETTGTMWVSLKDGQITNNILTEGVARGIQMFADIYNDGSNYDGSDKKEAFGQSKIAMMSSGVWYRVAFGELIVKGDVGFVPYPKDPESDIYYIPETFGMLAVPSNAPNPKASAAYAISGRYNYLNKVTNITAKFDGLSPSEQVELYGWTGDMEKWIYDEFTNTSTKTPVLSPATFFDISPWAGDMWFRPLMGEPWSAIAEEIAPAIDDKIAELYE